MKGVIACIQEMEDGITMLTFDDVSSEYNLFTNWSEEVLYTSKSYDSNAIENMNLTKEQYAEIGENLIIKGLLALNGKLK